MRETYEHEMERNSFTKQVKSGERENERSDKIIENERKEKRKEKRK